MFEYVYIYTGEYDSDQGKYVGEFLNGKFHGDGVLYVKEGKFEGVNMYIHVI
jgi:hypothetical protein